MTQRRRLYPMPVEGVIDHPVVLTMQASQYGTLLRLLVHYWGSECRPMPESDNEWQLIARCSHGSWARHGGMVRAAFEDIRPDLDHYYRIRQMRLNHMRDLGKRSVGVKLLRAQQKADQSAQSVTRTLTPKKPSVGAVAPPSGISGRGRRVG